MRFTEFFRTALLLALTVCQLSSYSQKVKRIVSLAPSITENLYLLGVQNKMVGCTSYCALAVNDGVQQIGSTIDVNVEKILTLKPDLVLTMLMTKPQDVEAMRKLGIRIEIVPTPKNFNEICEQTIEIGKLIGFENEAIQETDKAKQKVDSLKQLGLKNNKKQRIFFQLGSNPVFTVLPNTFMNDFILFCNGENIANGMTTGIISRESVLAKNPDVIIIATMGGFGAEEKKVWETYKSMNATKNRCIFLIDSETSCSPTPENFARAFADVISFVTQ
jgi:iron complex transport system substrate-binding protein